MDRTEEFHRYAGTTHPETTAAKETFYITLGQGLDRIEDRLSRPVSLRALLVLEEDLAQVQAKTAHILDSVRVTGPPDLAEHYAGIKQILSHRIARLSREMKKSKAQLCAVDAEIAPEKPRDFVHVAGDVLLEQENRRIVEHQDYENARLRLQSIEAVQRAISENLMIQNERIDSICHTSIDTEETCGKIAGYDGYGGGSLVRRAVLIIILCLIFVILFLHWF